MIRSLSPHLSAENKALTCASTCGAGVREFGRGRRTRANLSAARMSKAWLDAVPPLSGMAAPTYGGWGLSTPKVQNGSVESGLEANSWRAK